MTTEIPQICGIHHVKLPVRDAEAARDWYCEVLGFEREIAFKEDGRLMGVALLHPTSGVRLAFRHAPERADLVSGFDPVALAVTARTELEGWVRYLDEKSVSHGPIVTGTTGWPFSLTDPNGIEVRLYTVEEHSRTPPRQ